MEKELLQKQVNLLMGERLVMGFDAKKFAVWGVELLQDCYDSDNVRILAGLDYDEHETVDRYFGLVADELNLKTDYSEEQLLFHYAVDLVKKVFNGIVDPVKGVHLMYKIYLQSDYDSRYSVFMELDDAIFSIECKEYPYTWPELTNENKEEIIIKEFKAFLETAK